MKKMVILLVLMLFFCIKLQSQTFNISVDDNPDPSYGSTYTFEVTADFSQSTLGKIWIDVSPEHSISAATPVSSSGFTSVTPFPPGSTISSSNGGTIVSTYYLFSGFVDGYGGQTLKFKYKVTPTQSGIFTIKLRATYINGTTTIRYPSTGGCGIDQQGWRAFCEQHTHDGQAKPDLKTQDVKIVESSVINGVPATIRAVVQELNSINITSSFKVGFYVGSSLIGYKTVSSLTGGSAKNVDYPYTFPNSGPYTIKATADYENVVVEADETNNSYSRDITVSQNQSPTVSLSTPQVNGKSVTFNWSGSDPENQTLLFRYKLGNGTWSGWASSTTITYNNQPSGQSTFYVEVKDPGGLTGSDSKNFTIVNHAPVLNHIGNKTVDEGQLLEFTISGSDPDGDPLTYSAQNIPSGSNFDPATKKFSWTPNFQQSGTYNNVKFIVDDAEVSAYENITITVVNITTNAPVNAWPDDNKNLNAVIPHDKELVLTWYTGASQNITATTFSFNSTEGTSETFDITLTAPNAAPVTYFGVSQKEIQRSYPEPGFWKVAIKNVNGTTGNIKAFLNYTSNYTNSLPIMYFKSVAENPVIVWGLMTGVCPDDDYECLGADIVVGLLPVTSLPKDVCQASISGVIGCGYGAVGFIKNDPDQIATSKTYLKSAGWAGTSIGLTFAMSWWVDDAVKVSKLAKGTVEPAGFYKQIKLVGRQTELPQIAKEIDTYKHVMLIDVVNRPYVEKLDYLKGLPTLTDKQVGEKAVNEAMVRILSHPDGKLIPHAIYAGNEMEGQGYKLFAKKIHPELPADDLRAWDFTTAIFSKTGGVGLTELTDADIVVKDLTTQRYAIVAVTQGQSEKHNAVQIDKIINSIAQSNDASIVPYKGKTDVFGWRNKKLQIHPKGLTVANDSIFINIMKPTYVIIDTVKKVLNVNKITFHTENEVDNSGFLVVRCKSIDTVFQVASTFITGAGNSTTRKDYTYLDYFAEPNTDYKYLIYQYNIFNYLVYVSDTAKIYGPTDVKNETTIPTIYKLLPVYPNPFNPETRITFDIPEVTNVSLAIYDVLGKKVSDIAEKYFSVGQHSLSWTPKDLTSGIYVVVMRTEKYSVSQKVMYLK